MTLREEVIKRGFAADYIRYLIDFMEGKGFDRSLVLKAAGIEEADLDKGAEWIYYSIDYNRLSKGLMKMSGNDLLGLEFGSSIKLKDHGYIGYAAGNAQTLGEAVEMLVKYFRTRTTLFSLSIFDEEESTVIQLDTHAELGEGLSFWVQAIFGTLLGVCTEIFGQDLLLRLMNESVATLSFEKPKIINAGLEKVLKGLSFGHTVNQIHLPKHLMSAPLLDADKLVSEMAQKHCEDQLMNVEPMQQGIIVRVRKCLEAGKGGDYPDLEGVAKSLNMSSRSLKRKLKAVDSSFQVILDSVRKAQAIEYLCHSSRTIDDISRLLGFSDPSNFGRAFKKWTGLSPRAYRDRALANQ